jgi:putative addiction module CopG family antidote
LTVGRYRIIVSREIIAGEPTMPIEQMNISLPPKTARFIRGKVKAVHYTCASEVVRDAVRHMQEGEAAKSNRALLADFEAGLPKRCT